MWNDMENMEENCNFHIVQISSLFNWLFFHNFHTILQFSSVFSKSFHYSTYFSFIIFISKFGKYGRKISWRVKRYGKYERKASRIVIKFGKYGRKISWRVKRYGKYGRKASRIVIRYGQYGFIPYFPYLSTIQLPYCSNQFTIQLTFLS
jgi:hypothetical protein